MFPHAVKASRESPTTNARLCARAGYKPADLEAVVNARIDALPDGVIDRLTLTRMDRPAVQYAAEDDILQEVKDRLARSALLAGVRSIQVQSADLIRPSTHYDVTFVGDRFPPLEVLFCQIWVLGYGIPLTKRVHAGAAMPRASGLNSSQVPSGCLRQG